MLIVVVWMREATESQFKSCRKNKEERTWKRDNEVRVQWEAKPTLALFFLDVRCLPSSAQIKRRAPDKEEQRKSKRLFQETTMLQVNYIVQ